MVNNPAHVAIVIGSMRMGGAERAALNLANGLAEKGRCVSLVLVKAEGEFLESVNSSVKVVDLKCSRARFAINPLRKFIDKSKPDIILCLQNHVQLMVLLARKISGKKTPVILIEQSTYSKNQKNKWTTFLAKQFFNDAIAVAVTSNDTSIDFLEIFPLLKNKIRIIPNPVVHRSIKELASHKIEHPFVVNNIDPVILGVGRLSASKDFGTLIKAFSIARAKKKMKLIIIGEGEERQSLQTLAHELSIESDFLLPGFVANPYSWMNKANVFVMSSLYEGFPFALVEAMACGCPVISTNCPGGSAEILNYEEFGSLVPVKEENAMAEAILKTLENPSLKDKIQQRAAEFTSEKSISMYDKLINEILMK